MDLTNMIPGGAGEEKTPQQQLSKEEYAAMKKQQREEVWAEVDAQAQAVFQNGDSLKGFLDFMAQCNTQKTPNLLLIYGQNPEATVVKSYDYWKKEHRSPKSGVHGYTYMVSTEYEKDGEMRTGYTISKGFDMLWSSIFVTLMANKIGGLQFGIYRNCQISSRVFHTAVAALPLTKANRSDFE